MATAQLTAKVTTTGVSKAQSDLNKLSKTAKSTGDNVLKMEDRFKSVGKNASAAIAAVDGPLGGISSRISAVTTVLTSGTAAATGFGVAVAGVGAALVIGTNNLDDYNVNLARTEALLKATGSAAGFSAQELQAQASELALATLTSTKEVQAAQAQLLTFNRVTNDVFTDAIVLSQDLAASGFGTLSSNAVQLGKALQDPVNGISALTRVGVSFTSTQKDMIRSMQEAGDIAGAQAVVIGALRDQVGGAGASVAADSLAGKTDTAGQKWEEFTIALAQRTGALDIAGSAVDFLASSLQGLTDSITGGTLENQLDTVSTSISAQEAKINELNESLSRYSEENRNALNSGMALAQFETSRKKILSDLNAAQGQLNSSLEKQDELIAKIAEQDQAAADAAAEGLRTKARLDKEAADERERIAAERAAKEQARLDESFARSQAAALKELSRLEAANDSELEAISRREFDKLELIRGFREQGLITAQQFTDAETNIIQTGVDARTALRQKEADEAAALAEKQAAEQERIEQRRNDLAIDALRDTTSALKSTLGEQNVLYKAAAITKATIDTYNAANGAYAALSSIPVVGPALGAAAAGVAIGAGLANVQQIASARYQGGSLAAGQSSTIAEQNELEVIAPASASRVRTRQQMESIMGEGGGNGGVNITVINHVSNAEVSTEQDERGDIVMLIRETVANDLNTQNSRIAKARKNTRTGAGF